MSITELDVFCHEINWTKDIRNLKAIRAMFLELLDSHKISLEIYHQVNREIRDRSDFLKGRR